MVRVIKNVAKPNPRATAPQPSCRADNPAISFGSYSRISFGTLTNNIELLPSI